MPPFSRVDVPDQLAHWVPEAATFVFPEQGMTSAVAFVEPGGVVLKRCVDPIYLSWLRREREVLVALHEIDIPTPRALEVLDTGSEVWLVMSRVRGGRCATYLQRAATEVRCEVLRRVGVFLRRLHSVAVPDALRSPGRWIDRRLAEARRNLSWCDGSAELLARLEATRPSASEEVLLHGDLNLENLLVEHGVTTGLVDWAAGGAGDSRCDVALALQRHDNLVFTEAEESAFFDGYGTRVDHEARTWFENLYEFF